MPWIRAQTSLSTALWTWSPDRESLRYGARSVPRSLAPLGGPGRTWSLRPATE
jgi:hypothetical protein